MSFIALPTTFWKELRLATTQFRDASMSDEVERSLCHHLRTTRSSVQLDETTLPDKQSLLLSYVRFIKDGAIQEEMLFAGILKTDTKGITIFNTLKNFLDEEISQWRISSQLPLTGLVRWSVAIGAPWAVSSGTFQDCCPFTVLTIASILWEKTWVRGWMSQLVIDAVNLIRSKALNSRLFAQLCDEISSPTLVKWTYNCGVMGWTWWKPNAPSSLS